MMIAKLELGELEFEIQRHISSTYRNFGNMSRKELQSEINILYELVNNLIKKENGR